MSLPVGGLWIHGQHLFFMSMRACLRRASQQLIQPGISSWSLRRTFFLAVRSASGEGHFFARPPGAFFGCSKTLLVLRRRLRFFCPPLRKAMRCVYATEIASWGLRRSFFSAVRSASQKPEAQDLAGPSAAAPARGGAQKINLLKGGY